MKMVVGLAFTPTFNSVLMQYKNRPDICRNRLNGPGGKCDGDERPRHAMVREFYEETGLESTPGDWIPFHTEHQWESGNELHFFTTNSLHIYEAIAGTDEPLLIVPLWKENGFMRPSRIPYTVLPVSSKVLQEGIPIMPSLDSLIATPFCGLMYNMTYLLPMAVSFLQYPQHRYTEVPPDWEL